MEDKEYLGLIHTYSASRWKEILFPVVWMTMADLQLNEIYQAQKSQYYKISCVSFNKAYAPYSVLAPNSSFLIWQFLGGSCFGWNNWVPSTHMETRKPRFSSWLLALAGFSPSNCVLWGLRSSRWAHFFLCVFFYVAQRKKTMREEAKQANS